MSPVNSLGPVFPRPVEGAGARSDGAVDVDALAPPAAPGPDVRLERYREALELIADSGGRGGKLRCWDIAGRPRREWCPSCLAQYALDPWISSSPADEAPGVEAACPAVPTAAGHASNVPEQGTSRADTRYPHGSDCSTEQP